MNVFLLPASDIEFNKGQSVGMLFYMMFTRLDYKEEKDFGDLRYQIFIICRNLSKLNFSHKNVKVFTL